MKTTGRQTSRIGLTCAITAAAVVCLAAFATAIAPVAAPAAAPLETVIALPNARGSLKFAVFGDFGTGERPQYDLAARMAQFRDRFPFELVTLVGDNIYGSARPRDYDRKFAIPYRPLLNAGVTFYATLGNHDPPEQRHYELFNMKGRFYYSFTATKQDVRFIALDTVRMHTGQVKWLADTLANSRERWKVVFFHHPLYSSGREHGSDLALRQQLEPLFVAHGVDIVFTGHDHFYERSKPQRGITHFVTGSGGQLRVGDAKRGQPFSAHIVDTTLVFLAVEIEGANLVFNAVARDGRIVDSGRIVDQQH